MKDQIRLEEISANSFEFHIHRGPLLTDLLENSGESLGQYCRHGGYEVARRSCFLDPMKLVALLEEAGLRGRSGGGFPTGHKWRQIAESHHSEKYFICNANAGQPGGFKERFLLRSNPHRIIEALLLAAHTLGVTAAILCVPHTLQAEADLLEHALQEAMEQGLAGENAFGSGRRLSLLIYRSPHRYIIGEETALMEMIEGRVGQPRGKPPMPSARGLFGTPTAVNNLETLLHVYHIFKYGPAAFRETGTRYSPGSMIFSVSGHVRRPGLYELPLGTSLRQLIYQFAGGMIDGHAVKAVLPGGVCSPAVGAPSLEERLDYDSAYEAGFDLGSGAVIVVSEITPAVDLARSLAAFFHEKSCGKCTPCKEGTQRTATMLDRLEDLDQRAIDLPLQQSSGNSSTFSLKVLNNPGTAIPVSYTDTAQGLDKIRHLCQFYKHRGDCHHSTEAAGSIQRLLDLFPDEFEQSRSVPATDLERRMSHAY